MRARFINEKFKEHSDPISDMGIGALSKHVWANLKKGDILCLKKDIPGLAKTKGTYIVIISKKGPEIINSLEDKKPRVVIEYKYFIELDDAIKTVEKLKKGATIKTSRVWQFSYEWFKDIFEVVDVSTLSEKFQEDSDPIEDMDIGLMHEIRKFCKSKYPADNSKKDFLETCAKYGKLDYVKYLLDAGAGVHVAGVRSVNDYALQLAAENGHTDVVKVLLNAGADVHAENDYALRWAADNGHKDVVKMLLDAGADVHVNDDDALRWAAHNGHKDVIKVLMNHIAKEKKVNEKFQEYSDPIKDMNIGLKHHYNRLKNIIQEIDDNYAIIWETVEYDDKELTIRADTYEYDEDEWGQAPSSYYDYKSIGIYAPFLMNYYIDVILMKNQVIRSYSITNDDIPELDYWDEKIVCNNVIETSDKEIINLIVNDYQTLDITDALEEARKIAEADYEKTQKRIKG